MASGARGDARDAAAGWEVGAENGGGGLRFIFLRSPAGGVAGQQRDILTQRPSRGRPAYRLDRQSCPRVAGNPRFHPPPPFLTRSTLSPRGRGLRWRRCSGSAGLAWAGLSRPDAACYRGRVLPSLEGRAGKLPAAIGCIR